MPRASKRQTPRDDAGRRLEVEGLIGYDEPVRAGLTAFASGEHMTLLGAPGRAKSQFVRGMFAMVSGRFAPDDPADAKHIANLRKDWHGQPELRVWEVQVTKNSDESTIFGLPNIEKLLKGEVEYAEHVPALESDLWFIDEIFDAPDVVLRSLLSCMQERRFIRAAVPRPIPLHSVFATANYSRLNELTAALVDRFMITVNAPELTVKQRTMLYGEAFNGDGASSAKQGRFTLASMLAVREKANSVKLPAGIVKGLVELCQRQGFSPRREVKLAKLMRVYAALRNKPIVDSECLEPFKWALPLSVKEDDRNKALADLRKVTATFDAETTQEAELEALLEQVQSAQSTEGAKRKVIAEHLAAYYNGKGKSFVNAEMRKLGDKLLTAAKAKFGESEFEKDFAG